MTSTDAVAAPEPGPHGELVEQVVRTRQRRVQVADHPGQTLAALRTMDDAIDRAVQALRLYGDAAVASLDQRVQQLTGPARAAAIHLRIALAVQHDDPELPALFARLTPLDERAVADALAAFPVPWGVLGERDEHVAACFTHARRYPQWLPLTLRVVGDRDVRRLAPEVRQVLSAASGPQTVPDADHAEISAWAHRALACMGLADADTRDYVEQGLASGEAQAQCAALRICAADPRLGSDRALELGFQAPAGFADIAWGIVAARYPRRVLDFALALPELDPAIKLRLAALGGYVDTAILVCGELAARDGPVTPAEADVLLLVLGDVPMQARSQPNEREAKSRALRELLRQVCRRCHIALHNDADIAPWNVTALLAEPEHAATLRLRGGQRLRADGPALGSFVLHVTHGLRQWLYLERGVVGHHALPLSAFDVSRRQLLALMLAETVAQSLAERPAGRAADTADGRADVVPAR